jgi:cystathionine beta-lyase
MAAPVTTASSTTSRSTLRRRQSVKWQLHPADVLPAFVAEMDFARAARARCAARRVENDDCGYPHPKHLGEAFAGFAAERYGWTVDPSASCSFPTS